MTGLLCVGDDAQEQSYDDDNMSILDDTKVINNSSDFLYFRPTETTYQLAEWSLHETNS